MFEMWFEICALICCVVITGVVTYLFPQLAIILLNDIKDDREFNRKMKIEMLEEIEKW